MKIYQDRELNHTSKHPEVRQKYSAVRRTSSSFLRVCKCGKMWFLVFDILYGENGRVQHKNKLLFETLGVLACIRFLGRSPAQQGIRVGKIHRNPKKSPYVLLYEEKYVTPENNTTS